MFPNSILAEERALQLLFHLDHIQIPLPCLVLLNLVEKFQLDSADFISWRSNNQNCVTSLMDTALSKGIFGVPTFVFEEEIFWGSEKLALISAKVTGDYSALT